ncbi:MAG: glycosyltransferase family 2 protein [Chlorobi bacterium]|nr:glycosyltransferase family 2 protein [Chlorobiota bacterium]MCI0715277.1 glycosyltransferase family 2 protein [Chlorobiota bacterium]
MTLSIVIVNWNTKDLIKECIESILAYSPEFKYEIIVIDNASDDGSPGYLSSLEIVLIKNSENLGYAKAANQGMRIAKGKYVLMLGSDTVMKENTLKECVNFLQNNSSCGAVGCRLLNPDGSIQNSCKKFPKLKNAFFTYLSLDKLNKDYDMANFNYDKTISVEQIATTFLMVRKDVLEKVNYFDENYRILYNDVVLCKKIWEAGYKIYFLHTCSVIHHGSQSTKKADFELRKIMYSDIYRYYKNHFGFKSKFLYPILVFRLLVVSTIKA